MVKLLPEPKRVNALDKKSKRFGSLYFASKGAQSLPSGIQELIEMKLWNFKDIALLSHAAEGAYAVELIEDSEMQSEEPLFKKQGYSMKVGHDTAQICYCEREGLINALSTFKQLLSKTDAEFTLECCEIVDWPSIEKRSVSNTFAWYAGYGRLGFDMQLWGYDEWVEYLNICSDFKINQFNMCMYGFWPFEFDEYPETVLRDYKMKVYNPESRSWVEIGYTHPNVANEFLSRLMDYGHKLGFEFFAYIGLNSYSGGYACRHKEDRMLLSEGSKYVNDFDCLCLSKPHVIEYLKASIRRIVQLGYDGIDFEESEEAFWYCDCPQCKKNFIDKTEDLEAAKHMANGMLFKELYAVIKQTNPKCKIGIRAWRQPPLCKTDKLLKEMVGSVPEDVGLFWAPGLYVPEEEFEKWVSAFGKERIWARDTESNAVSSCFGRLIRITRANGLRSSEESNDQYLEEDINQHRGSVRLGVKGINGYMFEWYGFFLHLFAHAHFGWGSDMDTEVFYGYALEAVFGKAIAGDILYVLKNMFTIHESQLKIFPTEFPFARNKVEARDIPAINEAIKRHQTIMDTLHRIRSCVSNDERLCVYEPHFEKLIVANMRNRIIYDMALESIAYDAATDPEDKKRHLLKLDALNELNFGIVKMHYFDVNPVADTGTKSCMIPYHELKRVIDNELYPETADNEPIYLGVEALGWLWL